MPRDTNPLGWWKQNAFRFPAIGIVARSTLCIPATSTPSERLFCCRSSLEPENADALLFVTQYWKTSLIAALLILRYGRVKSTQV